MKRHLLFLMMSLIVMVVFTGYIQAQDVQATYEIDTIEFDSSTQGMKVTTVMEKIGKNMSDDSLTVYFQKRRIKNPAVEYKYYLCISSNMDLGCSGAVDNYVKIKFDNGDVIKIEKDISKINCKSPVESMFELKGEALEKLKTKNIKSLKLKQSKYYSDFEIWFPDFFIKSFRLLVKYI